MVTKTIRVQTETKLFEKVYFQKGKDREAETQTAVEFRNPLPVHFIPRSSGTEMATQIEEDELFDFNEAVEPVLEKLVGRTIETAVLELLEEAQLAKIRSQQQSFEKLRQSEIMEVRRLEAAETRKQEEKQRRIQQERCRIEITRIALDKMMSVKVAKDMFSNVCMDACRDLGNKGFFRDPILVELEKIYVPDLIQEAAKLYYQREKEIADLCDYIFKEPVKEPDYTMIRVLEEMDKKVEVNNALHAIMVEMKRLQAIPAPEVSILSQEPYEDNNMRGTSSTTLPLIPESG